MDTLLKMKEFIFVDLPSWPLYARVFLSILIVLISCFLIFSMWRSPATLPSVDPHTAQKIETGVRNFFEASDEISPSAANVFGHAKSIVRRFENEEKVFESVAADIERMKAEDANWTYANEWNAALALVNALGLSPKTEHENAIFLQIPLPWN